MTFLATLARLPAPSCVSFFDRFGDRRRWRVMRQLVRDRERLAGMTTGGSPSRPIAVASAAVVEVRAAKQRCPQCEADYRIHDHRAPEPGIRAVDVSCRQCGVARTLWFRLNEHAPN